MVGKEMHRDTLDAVEFNAAVKKHVTNKHPKFTVMRCHCGITTLERNPSYRPSCSPFTTSNKEEDRGEACRDETRREKKKKSITKKPSSKKRIVEKHAAKKNITKKRL